MLYLFLTNLPAMGIIWIKDVKNAAGRGGKNSKKYP
jgi:hypothetical protein